jgi:hypothetical protein
MVLCATPEIQISFLTSKKYQAECTDYEGLYSREWRKFNDQDAPDTQITIGGVRPAGECPIHDRWWITKGAGLRIVTSFNSLGTGKDSEISVMRIDEVSSCEVQLDQYLFGMTRTCNGQKIDYKSFSLR